MTRLALAAGIWSVVGAVLVFVGVHWLARAPVSWAGPTLAGALALGFLKGRYVLAGIAAVNARRILGADGRPPRRGVFPLWSWALVLLFAVVGAVLRGSSLPRPWVGSIYAAAGSALVWGSAEAWRQWFARRRRHDA